jgi:hydrogenase expression/formation protein HypE
MTRLPHPTDPREQAVLERIDRARHRKARLTDTHITLAHGAGGKATHALIEAVFLDAFTNPLLAELGDAAVFTTGDTTLALTTDTYVVAPLFFPGGDIGDLAVNGTVNDLAMTGATPRYLTAGFVLEEGFPTADLRRIAASMARAASAAGVSIVTGDTKVVPRGKADGCYINTAGVGLVPAGITLSPAHARPGDAILVSGPIGEHGTTIMLARGELDLESDLRSDTAPLHGQAAALVHGDVGLRCLRDATRGGVATVLNEIAHASRTALRVEETAIPIRPQVRGAAEILGIDPLHIACEGRMIAIVDGEHTARALRLLRAQPGGEHAAVIGEVAAEPAGLVLLTTEFGGTRIVDVLVGDPLPRIC